MAAFIDRSWPRFARAARKPDDAPPADWDGAARRWPHLQLAWSDGDQLIAVLNAAALWLDPDEALPETGWDGLLHRAAVQLEDGVRPNVLLGIAGSVHPEHRGRGLAGRIVRAFPRLAAEYGLGRVIIPVRPPDKANHPYESMSHYLARTRPDGLPIDGWLRTHVRVGGRILGIAERAWGLQGTAAEWTEWTGVPMRSDGAYPIPGGIVPVMVADGVGVYVEPNVWVEHPVPT
jgi:GNAT superfamily N-acetyltransferase